MYQPSSLLMQIPDVPPELKEWSENTLLGLFAGICYGGIRHYLRTRHEGGQRVPCCDWHCMYGLHCWGHVHKHAISPLTAGNVWSLVIIAKSSA